jgi:hypothetical protein
MKYEVFFKRLAYTIQRLKANKGRKVAARCRDIISSAQFSETYRIFTFKHVSIIRMYLYVYVRRL